MTKRILRFTTEADADAFETKMQGLRNMPIVGRNQKTGELQPNKQQTTEYTSKIANPETGDNRFIAFIDDKADTTGQTIITEDQAKDDGWFPFSLADKISESNSDIVRVAPYIITTSSIGFGSGAEIRDFISIEHRSRIRQSGKIERVTVPTGANIADANLEAFFIKIWRKNARGTFDLVSRSPDLLEELVKGGANTNVSVDIRGRFTAEVGDYVGYTIFSKGTVTDVIKREVGSNKPGTRFLETKIEEKNIDWDSQTGNNNFVPIQIYMTAPNIISIGPSTICGHNLNWTFVETDQTTDIPAQIVDKVASSFGWNYQNMAQGGRGTNQAGAGDARFTADVVDAKPIACIIGYGGGEVNSDVDQTVFITNMTGILDKCRDNNIIPIVLSIFPRTTLNVTRSNARRAFNTALETLTKTYTDAIYVPLDSTIGKIKSTTNQLDDLQDAFTDDGAHLTAAGNDAVTEEVIKAIENVKNTRPGVTP